MWKYETLYIINAQASDSSFLQYNQKLCIDQEIHFLFAHTHTHTLCLIFKREVAKCCFLPHAAVNSVNLES